MSHEPGQSPEQDRSLTNKLVSQRTIVPFEDYREYLEEELNCVQHLVRAHLVRSMSFADDRARPIEAFLRKSFTMHRDVPAPEQLELCDVHKREASELRKLIEARLSKTDERLLRTFPLWHVADQLLELRKRDKPRRLNTLDQDLLLITLLHEHWASVRAAIDSSYLEDGTLPGFLSDQWLAECMSSHRETPLSVLKRLQSGGILSRCGLIEAFEDRNHPTLHRVRVDDTIAEYLLNKSLNDRGLRASTRFAKAGAWEAVFLDDAVKQQLREYASRSSNAERPRHLWLHGPAGTRFVPAVQALLSDLKISQLLVADVNQGLSSERFPAWVAQVQRYARLARAAVLWNNTERIDQSDKARDYWSAIMSAPGDLTTFVAAEHSWDPVGLDEPLKGSFARYELFMPSIATRRSIWRYQLDGHARLPIDPQHFESVLDLLQGFQFTEGQIVDALTIADGIALGGNGQPHTVSEALYAACRRVSAHGLVSFTQRIAPRPQLATLDAVVLGGESRQLLKELDDRIHYLPDVYLNHGFADSLHVGQGLVALFSGPSGTGKTLAATVLASKNARDLYKVDMSAVVSKYVGETEKNLGRIFSDAQSSNALLFFDEADAIFGKRGDVERAQDRWANMEVNYLLQRIEEFSGVVILATNLKSNIDEAFVRRVQVIIEFQPPDAQARAKILSSMFPVGTVPPSEAEIEAYASRFELNGGNLKNVVMDAAFRAIQSGQSPLTITMRHLIQATAREFRKLSRPVTAATFGKYLSELDGLVITPNG